MMYIFIVNPHSRSGLGKHIWKEVQTILDDKIISYKVHFTKRPRHATEIVRSITSDGRPHTIIALGGDGTINEVINGIQDLSLVTLGYIPTGSSNDFARSYGLPTEPKEALENILSAKSISKMDVCELSYRNRKRRFAVSSGIGFDAAICHEAVVSKLKFVLNRLKLGKLTYVLIALRQWFHLKPQAAEISVDGGKPISFSRCYFIASMNQRYEGGGFMFAPDANPADGKLSVCVVSDIPKLKMLLLLPTALNGKHVRFKGIHTYNCDTITIHTNTALPVHTDGEPVFLQHDLTLRCLSEQLNIITSLKV